MTNGNFIRIRKKNGDGEEPQVTERLSELLQKDTKTKRIVKIMRSATDICLILHDMSMPKQGLVDRG